MLLNIVFLFFNVFLNIVCFCVVTGGKSSTSQRPFPRIQSVPGLLFFDHAFSDSLDWSNERFIIIIIIIIIIYTLGCIVPKG